MLRRASFVLPALLLGCGSSDDSGAAAAGDGATQVVFDLDADLTQPAHFFDVALPSDLRLTSEGTPDMRGFPNEQNVVLIDDLRKLALLHPGWPMVPVAYFRFTGPLPEQKSTTVVPADPKSTLLLVDVDATSDERGRLFPVVAATPASDAYVPENLLAVAARPGFILHPKRKYAFVVQRSLGDADGKPLGVNANLAALASNGTPAGALGDAAAKLYAPLWDALAKAGVAATDVAAATVFTTGDVVADLADLSSKVAASTKVQIRDLSLYEEPGITYDRFCRLNGKVTYPQFQKGTQPFDTQGLFETGPDGLPVKQGEYVDVPIVLTIPKQPMPDKGYPLTIYWHGSGGVSAAAVDRGPDLTGAEDYEHGKGPAYVVAPFGIATAASAMPVNPERLPGATEIEYINFNNLAAFPDTFRQGVIEQRMFIEALKTLEIPESVVSACAGPSLPSGQTTYKFDPDALVGQGQSMGGMYTNLIVAVEPRIRIAVPTGAGGFWSYFVLQTPLIKGVAGFIKLALHTPPQQELTFLHPALHLLETAWEPAEPLVFMPRIARRPLPGYHARPIYEPVGDADSYFPHPVYDAAALAYGHNEVGDEVWPEMQQALALDGLDGILPFPVTDNRTSENGEKYTGVIVQYPSDGVHDGHAIYLQLDAVKYQYGCFVSTFLTRGKATVPSVLPLGTPCP